MKKILVIRFSSIGDIVLTTPVLRCLKKQIPGTEIHYLTREAFFPLLKYNPYVSRVITWKKDVSEVIEILKNENYDLVIDLQGNLRSMRVKSALKKPSHTINKRNVEKWLLVNMNVNIIPKEHVVNRYLKTVEPLGLKNDNDGLDFFITAADKVSKEELPAPWRDGYVGFVIGAKHNTKKFPREKIVAVIKRMKLPVILIGGPEDKDEGDIIASLSDGYAFNACGRYGLLQSASLVKDADAIITNDTGFMHVAAAFHQRIVSVWGNTVPAFGMFPYLPEKKGESVIIENNLLTCRPCSKIGFEKCPKGHFKCMLELDEERIARQVNSWWNQKILKN